MVDIFNNIFVYSNKFAVKISVYKLLNGTKNENSKPSMQNDALKHKRIILQIDLDRSLKKDCN